jgi:RNA polymerase sigma factor (sigma-70 family)
MLTKAARVGLVSISPKLLERNADQSGMRVTRRASRRHRCGVGSELTVEDAYRKWADDLVRYATVLAGRSDAADVVGDAFASVLARGEPWWTTVRDPRAYLFRAVLNSARMRVRSTGRRERRESLVGGRDAGEPHIDPAVSRAVAALSVQQRAVIFLAYWEDLRPADIAAVLRVSEGSVRRQLARARTSLRKVLT